MAIPLLDTPMDISHRTHAEPLVAAFGRIAAHPPVAATPPPPAEPLVDAFGRIADDLRVSVTDRCNFRCTYCMPAEGLEWLPKDELLTFEELARGVRVFVGLGVRSLKVTGGGATVRAARQGL